MREAGQGGADRRHDEHPAGPAAAEHRRLRRSVRIRVRLHPDDPESRRLQSAGEHPGVPAFPEQDLLAAVRLHAAGAGRADPPVHPRQGLEDEKNLARQPLPADDPAHRRDQAAGGRGARRSRGVQERHRQGRARKRHELHRDHEVHGAPGLQRRQEVLRRAAEESLGAARAEKTVRQEERAGTRGAAPGGRREAPPPDRCRGKAAAAAQKRRAQTAKEPDDEPELQKVGQGRRGDFRGLPAEQQERVRARDGRPGGRAGRRGEQRPARVAAERPVRRGGRRGERGVRGRVRGGRRGPGGQLRLGRGQAEPLAGPGQPPGIGPGHLADPHPAPRPRVPPAPARPGRQARTPRRRRASARAAGGTRSGRQPR